jgi:hypothetical protein
MGWRKLCPYYYYYLYRRITEGLCVCVCVCALSSVELLYGTAVLCCYRQIPRLRARGVANEREATLARHLSVASRLLRESAVLVSPDLIRANRYAPSGYLIPINGVSVK